MKAAAYIRVSTDEQGPENQLPRIKALCQARGWELLHVYSEHARVWKSGHQRELAQACRDARANRFKVLVVWALDRLSREGIVGTFNTLKRFQDVGVKVVSINEPWTEVDDHLHELLTAIVAWVAEFESRRRSERTKAGIERVRAQGKRWGRPKGS